MIQENVKGKVFLVYEDILAKNYYYPISSFIEYIEYSYFVIDNIKKNEKLRIKFTNGDDFEYSTIELCNNALNENGLQGLFLNFVKAESVGKFWHKYIKNKLQYKRIR